MTGKSDNEAADAPAGLEGLSDKLGVFLATQADAFLDETHDVKDIDRIARKAGAIARAAVAVHALKAAEDKGELRAVQRKAARAAALVFAGAQPDEGDETDMNDGVSAPAESLDQVRARVERRFEVMAGWARKDSGDPQDGAGPAASGRDLVCKGERAPTPPTPH